MRQIGRGAMGCVYLAHDPQIDRRVAIKTIASLDVLPPHEREEARLRFVREAQAAGKLQHPGIVTIYDVGEQGGVGFIAMEYIEGETFEAHAARSGLLPMEQALALVAQACDALDYAHREKVIHRDIKPANLMLLPDGKVKITDFGLAKNPKSNLTQEGILVGTPNYMSPEQIMGGALDGRSDLFSLAAVLYELLTGVKPFEGETITTIIYRIVHEAPREPRSIKAGLPSTIGRAVLRGLDKDPTKRFQSGAEMARALRNWQVQTAVMGSATMAMAAPAMPGMVSVPFPSDREERGRSSGRIAPRPAVASGVREVARPAVRKWNLLARGGFILVAAAALILLLPAATSLDDRWGHGPKVAGGTATSTAAPAAPAPPPLPDVALPGQTAMMVSLPVSTDPAGAKLYLDDVEVAGNTLRLERGGSANHTLVAETDCMIETLVITPQQVASGGSIHMPLRTPKIVPVTVATVPPGAHITLDGKETGKVTPHELQVATCGEHQVGLALKGFTDVTTKLAQPPEPLNVTLVRVPEGLLKITTDYPVTVFKDGRKIGSSGEPLKLRAGRHTLTLRNDDLFLERTVSVDVGTGKTMVSKVPLPGVGTLTVLASPSNCTIFINGRDMGAPPIIDYKIAEGTYAVRAVFVPTGEAKESAVVVAAGAPARVPFKFTP